MVVTSYFHLRKIFIFLFSLIALCLLVSLTLLQKKTEDTVLPFDANELDATNSNRFLHIKDAFRQPVPNVDHLRYHQNTAKPCKSNSPTLLIIIHSAPAHVLHRKAIRQTWSSFTDGMTTRTVFIVGRSVQSQVWQHVKREASDHGDIVLVDMPDSYSNLTLKHLVGIRWVLENCPGATYVLKADDDAFVDMHRVKSIVLPALSSNAIACRIVPAGSAPRRSGKWKVSRNDYPFDDYPEYCSGLAYFSKTPTFASLYNAAVSGKVPYLWIDDVFITGFSATYAHVNRIDFSVWFARTEDQVVQWLKNSTTSHPLPWMVAEISPRHWPSDAFAIWNKTRTAAKNIEM